MKRSPDPALLTPDELNVALFVTTAIDGNFAPLPYQIAKRLHLSIVAVLKVLDRLELMGFVKLPPTGYGYIHLTPWARPTPRCRCCGEPMNVFEQPGVDAHHAPIEQADCRNKECALYAVTLALYEHDRLTDKQIAGYARVNARQAHMGMLS